MAVSYQQQAHDVVTVLLLDEVGLAEHSPDMPLKVCERGTIARDIAQASRLRALVDELRLT